MASQRIAVVLLNLGGPDKIESVRPFLFNLFNDHSIIGVPQPLRGLIAAVISMYRAPVARRIYAHLGGVSPLLGNTEAQAQALAKVLKSDPESDYRVFIAMRYWHPLSDETVSRVAAYNPHLIVLLPLYPCFSTTTTGSSLAEWSRAAAEIHVPTRIVCCYPTLPGMISAMVNLIWPRLRDVLESCAKGSKPRLLFSAHGLPKRIIDRGDPYVWQIGCMAELVVRELCAGGFRAKSFEWLVCYQSRVGPFEWIGPSTKSEIVRGAQDGVPLVVFPIAFVSEHAETLVELDFEYRQFAEELGVPSYVRIPTLGTDEKFIGALAGLVRDARGQEKMWCSCNGARLCPGELSQCPNFS